MVYATQLWLVRLLEGGIRAQTHREGRAQEGTKTG